VWHKSAHERHEAHLQHTFYQRNTIIHTIDSIFIQCIKKRDQFIQVEVLERLEECKESGIKLNLIDGQESTQQSYNSTCSKISSQKCAHFYACLHLSLINMISNDENMI
jgi:hypothetical protein